MTILIKRIILVSAWAALIQCGWPIRAYAQTVTFSTPGTTTWTVPSGVSAVNVLVVGGGGGGGWHDGDGGGGGGGGGGVRYVGSYAVSTGQQISITVGSGGSGGYDVGGFPSNGGNSVFGTVTAYGGGGGGNWNHDNGWDGGSGGGGTDYANSPGGSGAAGQGTAGGSGNRGSYFAGGGGGGATVAGGGGNSNPGYGGAGGNGYTYNGVAYGSGGGGGTNANVGAAPGGAGAGSGGTPSIAAGNGVDGRGGGGGGSGNSNGQGGSGGSGIVIVTYSTAAANGVLWNAINTPSTASPGQTISFTASVTNAGSTYWDGNYFLEVKDQNGTPLHYASVSGTSPGATITVTFPLTLPSSNGTYTYYFTAMQSGVQYFGGTQSRSITANSISSGSGTGLLAQYYDNSDFTALTLTRTDPTVNFSWGNGSPATSIGVDTFSVRWTGKVQPRYSETYTFTTTSDDGVRLWVNGVQLIDNWTDHPEALNSGSIALTANQQYDIRMDFYENGGGATARLAWQSASQAAEIIPASQLYPGGTPPSAPTAYAATGSSASGFTATWSGVAAGTGYLLDVATDSAFSQYLGGYQNLDVGNVTSRVLSGLNANTTYYYRVRTYSGSGTSGNSNTITVATSGPTAPVANAATAITTAGFTANWATSSGATGYRLDVSTSSSFSSYVLGYQDLDVGNVTARSVSGLGAATTYYYRVRAYNGTAVSSNSNTVTQTTSSSGGGFVSASGGVTYSSGNDRIHVFTGSGTFSVSTGGAIAEVLIVGGGGGGGQGDWSGGGGGGGGVQHLTNVTLGAGSYSITVGAGGAVSANGGSSSGFGFTALGGGAGGVYFGGAGASGGNGGGGGPNGSGGVGSNGGYSGGAGYDPGLGTVSGGGGGAGGLGGSGSYTNELTAVGGSGGPGLSYNIGGVGYNVSGGGGGGCDVEYRTQGAGNTWGGAPAGSSATANTGGGGGGCYYAGYYGGNTALAGTGGSGIVVIRYQYQISSGSEPSVPVANAASAISTSGFTANWSASTGASGYRLDVSTSSTFSSYVAGYQDLDVGAVTSRSVGTLASGTTYYFRLRAYNVYGTTVSSNVIATTTASPGSPPAAPSSGAATSVAASAFTANWAAVSGASGYRLDVSITSSFSSYVLGYQDLDVGNVTARSTSGLNAGTTYYYRVRAYNGFGVSANSSAIAVVTTIGGPVNGNGPGLVADYYSGMNFENYITTNAGENVAYDWGGGGPFSNDNFSIRWQGRIMPRYTEAYTFITRSDDGVRLWINDELVVDNWTDHGPIDDYSRAITLRAGAVYNLRMDFYENGGGATAYLFWQSASQSWEIIPTTQLYTTGIEQPGVGSTAASTVLGQSWSPLNIANNAGYQGGAGTGPWEFVVAGQTNWDTTPWTPAAVGTYSFYVIRRGDAQYNQSAPAGPYTLTVTGNPPAITSNPLSQTVVVGASVTFNVVANGPSALSYQWRRNGVNLTGANSSTLTLNNVQAGDAGNYDVVVTSGAGSVSSAPAILTVSLIAPSITTQPASLSINAGQMATFAVAASGSAPLTYQWRKNGANIAGATGATYSIANAQSSDAANSPGYSVVVTNGAGAIASNSVGLTVNLVGPSITTQPAAQTVNAGQTATFSVAASGSVPLTYQWKKNGASIAGATGVTYSIANAQPPDAANLPGYSVTVTNGVGTITSNAATLTVNLVSPSIATQPVAQTVNVGQTATFSVVAAGSAPFYYQWRKNGASIAGANGASYSITNTQAADAASYSVVVSNSVGSITSGSGTLTVVTSAPIRLAVQYWQGNDWPNKETGGAWEYRYGWHAAVCWDVGHDTDDDGIDDTWETVCDPEWVGWSWEWVTYYAEDGLYGSRWDTTAGTFDINNETSSYGPAAINRGYFLNPYGYADLITFRVFGSAPSANCNNYSWTLFSPAGAEIAGSSFSGYSDCSFYPNAYGSSGAYRIDVKYQGATGTNTPSGIVSYYIPVEFSPPSLPAINLQPSPATRSALVGTTLSYSVATSGASSFQWLKNGAVLNGATDATLTLSNIQTSDTGLYAVVVGNTAGSITSNAVSLTVNPPIPVITSNLAMAGTVGTAFTSTITATNMNYPPSSFGSAGLPSGLSLNASSGAISGTPTQAGIFNVILTATNSGGTSPAVTLILTIASSAAGDDGTPQLKIHRPL